MCRFEEVVLDGDDEAGGESIAIEGEALRALFGGAVVSDTGLHVFQAAVLTPQQLTLYCPFSLESLPLLSVIPLPSPNCLDEALGDPHDCLKVSLPDCQCGGRGPRRDGLDFRGWEASAGWRRLRGFSLHIDGLVGHVLIAVGVVKGAVGVFAEV